MNTVTVARKKSIAAELTDLGVYADNQGNFFRDVDGKVTLLPSHPCDWPEKGDLQRRGRQAAAQVVMKTQIEIARLNGI